MDHTIDSLELGGTMHKNMLGSVKRRRGHRDGVCVCELMQLRERERASGVCSMRERVSVCVHGVYVVQLFFSTAARRRCRRRCC